MRTKPAAAFYGNILYFNSTATEMLDVDVKYVEISMRANCIIILSPKAQKTAGCFTITQDGTRSRISASSLKKFLEEQGCFSRYFEFGYAIGDDGLPNGDFLLEPKEEN